MDDPNILFIENSSESSTWLKVLLTIEESSTLLLDLVGASYHVVVKILQLVWIVRRNRWGSGPEGIRVHIHNTIKIYA